MAASTLDSHATIFVHNTHGKHNCCNVEIQTGKTGTGFDGVTEYVRHHGKRNNGSVLEDVVGLPAPPSLLQEWIHTDGQSGEWGEAADDATFFGRRKRRRIFAKDVSIHSEVYNPWGEPCGRFVGAPPSRPVLHGSRFGFTVPCDCNAPASLLLTGHFSRGFDASGGDRS